MEIQRFDPNTMRQHETNLIIGSRIDSKTTLAKDILRYKNGQKIVIHPSKPYTNAYANITKPEFIYDTYSEEILANVISAQKKKFRQLQNFDYVHCVLDDCIYDSQKRPSLGGILSSCGRSYRITLTICAQIPIYAIPSCLCACVDCVFIFNNTIVKNRRRLYEHYVGNIATFDDFCLALDSLKRHECLVIQKYKVFRYHVIRSFESIMKHPEFTSQLRIIGRTRFIKNELLARVLK